MDMYKEEEMNVSGADLYSGLQKIFPDERNLTLTERLEAAVGPLLSWYRGNKRDLPGGRIGMLTGSGFLRSCCSRRGSKR